MALQVKHMKDFSVERFLYVRGGLMCHTGRMRRLPRASRSAAMRFVILIGITSLFADFTYEAARSVNGQFLAALGASATIVGFTAGFGELAGYGLRSVFGWLADRSGRYWLTAIIGYAINLLAVPALALAGDWPLAAALIIAERAGRAMRKPAVEAMLSAAGTRIGQGWAFGLNEALDQAGATLGPLVMSLVLLLKGDYRTGYATLAISALFALATLLIARRSFPKPRDLAIPGGIEAKGLRKTYWWYMLAGGCIAAGFADFALIGYHFQQARIIPADLIPVYYAAAMGVGSVGALVLGRLFDKSGIKTLLATFFVSLFFAPLVFLGGAVLAFAGILLWGVGMAAQESLLKPLLAQILATNKKATAFGLYDTGFGAAWFLGSWLMGYLYSRSVPELVVFSIAIQVVSLPIFWLAYRQTQGAGSGIIRK